MSAPAPLSHNSILQRCKNYLAEVNCAALSEAQVKQGMDLISLCNQIPNAPELTTLKDKVVKAIQQHFDSTIQKTQSVSGSHLCPNDEMQRLIKECQTLTAGFEKAMNPSGQSCVKVEELKAKQIREIESLLDRFNLLPVSANKESAEKWKAALTMIVQTWKELNPLQTALAKPSSLSAAMATLTPEEKFKREYIQLERAYNPSQAQALLNELELVPSTKAIEDLKGFVLDLIVRKTAISSGQVSPPSASNPASPATTSRDLPAYENSFEAPLKPVGIRNEGNSCFAAAFMQLVCMNTVLSGAYLSLLPKNHYACQVINAYRAQQKHPSTPMSGIAQMRKAFGDPTSRKQEDAAELCRRINNSLAIPGDGAVTLENNKKAAYGHFLKQFVQGNYKEGSTPFRPFSVVPNSIVSFPIIDLTVNEKTADLNYILNKSMEALYFSQNPTAVQLTMCRTNGVSLDRQAVDLPLLYAIPKERKMPGVADELYTLQGFLTHMGTEKSGHYIAHHQWQGKFYCADDSIIAEITQADYLLAARNAYHAVYAKVSPRK